MSASFGAEGRPLRYPLFEGPRSPPYTNSPPSLRSGGFLFVVLKNRLLNLQAGPDTQRVEGALDPLGGDALALVVLVLRDLLDRHAEGIGQIAQGPSFGDPGTKSPPWNGGAARHLR